MEKKLNELLNNYLVTLDNETLEMLCASPEMADTPADARVCIDFLDEIFGEADANKGMDV